MNRTDPVAFFTEVAALHPRCFWLDGGGARQWSGRRSIIGWLDDDDVSLTYDAADREVTRHQGGEAVVVGTDIFDVLEGLMVTGDQWFGYFGYAARSDLPARPGPLPDAVWMRARHVRFFEHAAPSLVEPVEAMPSLTGFRGSSRSSSHLNQRDGEAVPPTYAAAYERVQEHLHAGNSYEVNLTYRADEPSHLSPAAAYLHLRQLNPAPYAGFLQHDVPHAKAWLLSSSPERFALIDDDRNLETKPIKGTLPRGVTPEEDQENKEILASHPKFRAENLMIVDLLRNDVAMVCEPGSVTVPQLMEVESYASVHQLVSTVRGRLLHGVSTVQALRSLFPAGSMTGAPKLRTMQIIDEVEETPRGPYAGAFGWISGDGRADLGVVIRSLMTNGDGVYALGTGGGITVQSTMAEEYAEAQVKALRLRQALTRPPHGATAQP